MSKQLKEKYADFIVELTIAKTITDIDKIKDKFEFEFKNFPMVYKLFNDSINQHKVSIHTCNKILAHDKNKNLN